MTIDEPAETTGTAGTGAAHGSLAIAAQPSSSMVTQPTVHHSAAPETMSQTISDIPGLEPWTDKFSPEEQEKIAKSVEAEKFYRKAVLSKHRLGTMSRGPSADLDERGERVRLPMKPDVLCDFLLSCHEPTCSHSRQNFRKIRTVEGVIDHARKPTYDEIEANAKTRGQYFCNSHLSQRAAANPGWLSRFAVHSVGECGQEYTLAKHTNVEDAVNYGDRIKTEEAASGLKTKYTYRCTAATVDWQRQHRAREATAIVPYSYLNEDDEEFSHCSAYHCILHRWQEPHAPYGADPRDAPSEVPRSLDTPTEAETGI
ncbi:hypothetical protein IAU59_007460 [Kwoniella sp. CBS 9459]